MDEVPSRPHRLAVQARAPRRDGWSQKRRQIFFDELANSCNVRAACAAAGMRQQSAYRLRNRDASFRLGWRQALGEGYAKLELALLERALIGEARLRGAVARAASDADALTLLSKYPMRVAEILYRSHRATVQDFEEPEHDPDGEEAIAEVERRLEKLRAHLVREIG